MTNRPISTVYQQVPGSDLWNWVAAGPGGRQEGTAPTKEEAARRAAAAEHELA